VAGVDHLQSACIRRVVVAEKVAVVNRETVAPEVKLTMCAWGRCGDVGGGIWDGTRRSIVATKRSTCTAEVRASSWLLFVTTWSGSIPISISLCGAEKYLIHVLSCSLQDVVDLVARVRLVGILNGKTRLLTTGKEVLVLVVFLVIVVLVVVVSVSMSAT
jgi:hypothetical protein